MPISKKVKKPVRVIIAGSRNFDNYTMVINAMNRLMRMYKLQPTDLEIVSGGARGADKLGERFALLRGIPLSRYPAEWNKHGKSAGYKRNIVMAENADILLAFWDGASPGTKHMMATASRYGLSVFEYPFGEYAKHIESQAEMALEGG